MIEKAPPAKLEQFAHGELAPHERRAVREALREDKELAEMFQRLRDEDRMIVESLAWRGSTHRLPAQAGRRSRPIKPDTTPRPTLTGFTRWVRAVSLRRVAAVVLALACAGIVGYAAAMSQEPGVGAVDREGVEAINGLCRKYIAAAKKGDLKSMHDLSDRAWRNRQPVGKLTLGDQLIAAGNMEPGDVSTTWGGEPETNVTLFRRRGPGGMALVFFVRRENGQWVVDRSRNSALETSVAQRMKEGAALCAQLIRDNSGIFEEKGSMTVSYRDLTKDQRGALLRFFGIVNGSGKLTTFGRGLGELEQAMIRIDRGHGRMVVVHLLVQIDHFLAVHLEDTEETARDD